MIIVIAVVTNVGGTKLLPLHTIVHKHNILTLVRTATVHGTKCITAVPWTNVIFCVHNPSEIAKKRSPG